MLPTSHIPGLKREVSVLGAGCWTIGGTAVNDGVPIGWDNVDPDEAYAALAHAHELGVTLFDTADVYGLGRSERLLGRLLRQIPRAEAVVSSKVGYFAGTASHPYHPLQMCRQLATTLDNLGTDYLDLYFLHSTDFGPDDRYLAEAVDQIRAFRDEGVVRAIGMRAPHTFAAEWAHGTGWRAIEAARFLHLFEVICPDVVVARYNLLSPLYTDQETDIVQFARQHRVGVLIKQALGQGLLLDTQPAERYSSGDHRAGDPRFTEQAARELRARLAPLRARFGNCPADMAHVALRYALHHAPESAVLLGFRNTAQIHTTLTSLGDPLTPAEITEIRTLLYPPTAQKGHRL